MCIICLQHQKDKDLQDAFRMLQSAIKEPSNNIDKEHLKQLALDSMIEETKQLGISGYTIKKKD